jgi:hypothetical protein
MRSSGSIVNIGILEINNGECNISIQVHYIFILLHSTNDRLFTTNTNHIVCTNIWKVKMSILVLLIYFYIFWWQALM